MGWTRCSLASDLCVTKTFLSPLCVLAMADTKKILSRGSSCRGYRGGVLKKLQGFEKIAEDSELSPLAAKLQRVSGR